jgi:hypothetical protein
MQPLQFIVPFDALEAVEPFLKYLILGLVLLNMATRLLGHRKQVQQVKAGDDDDALTRFFPHTLTNVALILASFLLMIFEPHAGMVLSVLVVGMFLADFFEYESRRVEARTDKELEPPKAAVGASLLVLLYAGYQSLFFLIADYWNLVV